MDRHAGGHGLAAPRSPKPDITQIPTVQPDGVFVTSSMRDWAGLSDADRAAVRFLLLQNGDDPIPKFEASLLWRRPGWLGPDDTRPHGAPRGTRWLPVTTFFTTFIDLQNALAPTPGVFSEGGHDYRLAIPEALRTVFRCRRRRSRWSGCSRRCGLGNWGGRSSGVGMPSSRCRLLNGSRLARISEPPCPSGSVTLWTTRRSRTSLGADVRLAEQPERKNLR